MSDAVAIQIVLAVPTTLASLAACIYAIKSHGQSLKNTEVLKEVVAQTNGMSEKLQQVAEEKGHREGLQEQIKNQNKL